MKDEYVTFDTAKLLKEKGFDWFTFGYYTMDDYDSPPYFGIENLCADNWNGEDDEVNDFWFSAPTQQMACRWLREEHNILVCVLPCEVGAGVMDYTYCIYRIHSDNYYFEPLAQGRIEEAMDYENTLEAGLEYVLKNLI